jgi:hypothetical protein
VSDCLVGLRAWVVLPASWWVGLPPQPLQLRQQGGRDPGIPPQLRQAARPPRKAAGQELAGGQAGRWRLSIYCSCDGKLGLLHRYCAGLVASDARRPPQHATPPLTHPPTHAPTHPRTSEGSRWLPGSASPPAPTPGKQKGGLSLQAQVQPPQQQCDDSHGAQARPSLHSRTAPLPAGTADSAPAPTVYCHTMYCPPRTAPPCTATCAWVAARSRKCSALQRSP